MNLSIFNSDRPPVTLTYTEFTDVVRSQIAQMNNSFDFSSLLANLGRAPKLCPQISSNSASVIYKEELHNIDKGRVREIVWDFIIARMLTIGDFHSDTWPALSRTERGLSFFNEAR
jgi:hypothetical protein